MKRNTVTVRITGYNQMAQCDKGMANVLERLCFMRTARKVGDTETINHFQLGKLKQFAVPYEVVK